MKVSIYQKNVNRFTLKNKALEYMKQKLTELKS